MCFMDLASRATGSYPPSILPDALEARKKTDEATETNPRAHESHRSL